MAFLKALAVFLGTIVGAGIFGLPYVASKAGFLTVLIYFIFLSFSVAILYLIYLEVILGTKGFFRLPGYAEKYLGRKWKIFSFLVIILGIVGSLLAYLIIGGGFLNNLLSPYLGGSFVFYVFLFFIPASYLVFKGIKSIAGIELVLLSALLIVLALFLKDALPFINMNNFLKSDTEYFFLPYGVILFSLWGSAVIPEIKEMLPDRKNLRKIIISATVLSVIIYLAFIFIIFGSSGFRVSQDAISGIAETLGSRAAKLGFIMGSITCFTSFLTLAITLKKTLEYDFKIHKNVAWAISCFFPLTLILLGVSKFINVISFTGAVALGLESLIIIFIYRKFNRNKFNSWLYILSCILMLGVVLGLVYLVL